jgi:hypothetical protein
VLTNKSIEQERLPSDSLGLLEITCGNPLPLAFAMKTVHLRKPLLLLVSLLYLHGFAGPAIFTLEEFGMKMDLQSALLPETKGSWFVVDGQPYLRLRSGGTAEERGLHLKANGQAWELGNFSFLEVEVTNFSDRPLPLNIRLDGANAEGERRSIAGFDSIPAGETERVRIALAPTPWRLVNAPDFMGMRFDPGELQVQLDTISAVSLFLSPVEEAFDFALGALRATGIPQVIDVDDFFPFVDRFGQFIHGSWPGKVTDEWELRARAAREASALTESQGPVRSRFGGWKNEDHRRTATGHFRVEKVDGRWWIIDPEGYLFWSHGVNSVNSAAATPVSEREHYFSELPQATSPFSRFYGENDLAPQGDYRGYGTYRTYNHLQANLYRKYGEDWAREYNKVTHDRFRSWGLNTIGNWSDPALCKMQRTAYTLPVHFEDRARRIEGSEGYWMQFPDMFDPEYRAIAKSELSNYAFAFEDPWFIGFFVDNELGWGQETYLAEATLASPPDQAAKQIFADRLKAKYGDIKALNKKWETRYPSWEALIASRDVPQVEKAREDLADFSAYAAKVYFQTNRDIIREVAPGKLYLGCRFHETNTGAIRAAAAYCDIITINKYAYELNSLSVPEDIDRPIMIGEFHFGAPDRGVFGPGLKPVATQAERASLYRRYVKDGLRHPLIVGTHWFLYADQPTTGRFDGENFQIGLIDVTDTPYEELVTGVKAVGHRLYAIRTGLSE